MLHLQEVLVNHLLKQFIFGICIWMASALRIAHCFVARFRLINPFGNHELQIVIKLPGRELLGIPRATFPQLHFIYN